MSAFIRLGAVVMANGLSTRFGSNKLLAPFRGETLVDRALGCIPAERFLRVSVVTRYPAVAIRAAERSFTIVEICDEYDDPARTIRAGLDSMPANLDGCMFMVCDQPMLRTESIQALCDAFVLAPNEAHALGFGTRRGNPVLFPSSWFGALRALPAGKGGAGLLAQNPDRVRLVQVGDPLELRDADTPEQLDGFG